jgi:hypothetical protein
LRWPRDTLYPQKLALISPTSGGRSVDIIIIIIIIIITTIIVTISVENSSLNKPSLDENLMTEPWNLKAPMGDAGPHLVRYAAVFNSRV